MQDDWKVNQRLTINAGIRYTLNFPSTEFDNQGAMFNLADRATGLFWARMGFPAALGSCTSSISVHVLA